MTFADLAGADRRHDQGGRRAGLYALRNEAVQGQDDVAGDIERIDRLLGHAGVTASTEDGGGKDIRTCGHCPRGDLDLADGARSVDVQRDGGRDPLESAILHHALGTGDALFVGFFLGGLKQKAHRTTEVRPR